jgi:hypothetical protein
VDGWYHNLPRPPYPTKQRWVPTRAPVTTLQDVDGTLSFSGDLTTVKLFTKSVDGVLSFSGALVLQTNKSLAGTLSFDGALTKQTSKVLTGVLSFAGALAKQTSRALSGVVSFAGDLIKQTSHALTGALSFVGDLTTLFIPGAPPSTGSTGPKRAPEKKGIGSWMDE